MGGGLKKKSENIKPEGKCSFYLARLEVSHANQYCVICTLHSASKAHYHQRSAILTNQLPRALSLFRARLRQPPGGSIFILHSFAEVVLVFLQNFHLPGQPCCATNPRTLRSALIGNLFSS